MHTPGSGRIAGEYRGSDAVFAHFGEYAGETGGSFKAILQHAPAGEDGCVVGVHHNSAERNGKQLDVDCCSLLEVKDGRLIDGREHLAGRLYSRRG